MKRISLLLIFTIIGFSLFAQAGETGTKPASATPPSADIEALQTASLLAKYGYDSSSASALIGAAEILVYIQTQPLGTTGTQSGQTADSGSKSGNPEYPPANLLADARRLAGRDATMLAWASEVEAAMNTRTRGAVGGPRYQVDRANAFSNVTYQLQFRGGQLAEVLVSGDGDTDLDLYIYNANGVLVGYDEYWTDDCYVSWVPPTTQTYTIIIRNLGRVYNLFQIWTN